MGTEILDTLSTSYEHFATLKLESLPSNTLEKKVNERRSEKGSDYLLLQLKERQTEKW